MFGKKKKKEEKLKKSNKKQQGITLYIDDDTYITVKIGNYSHQGEREYQEDSFGYSNLVNSDIVGERGFAAVLADGMGGLSNGRDISKYVVSSFIKMFDEIDNNTPYPVQLENIVRIINKDACNCFSKNGKATAGSTIAAVIVYKTKIYWVCIGDSRLYLMRNGMLYAANEDHDYFNRLLSNNMKGDISMDKINADEQKDRLTSYIGNENIPFIDINKKGFSINKGDMLILCSDGIYNGVSDAEMIDILSEYEPQKASEKISRAVLDKRIAGQDNLTVMVIGFGS